MLKQFFLSFAIRKIRTSKTNNKNECITDRGVLLLQLTHDCRVVPLASHEEPEHLLSVFGHDEL